MPEATGKHPCPVCGEIVDLDDKEAAVNHMTKDTAHKKLMERVQAEQVVNRLVGTGILRRI
tara:strand:- start:13606 stop:13788 length:183 start_codon:yes stop_codon:yes gene_type:complete